MRELAKAQNELAFISQRSVTPAPDAEANSKWLLLRGTLDLVGVTIRGLGSAARYAGETMFRHLPDSVQDSVSTVLHRERVRHDVMQISMTFDKLTAEQARTIRTAVAPTQVTVQFWMFDELVTKTMYAGNRKWDEWYDNAGEAHISLQLGMSEY